MPDLRVLLAQRVQQDQQGQPDLPARQELKALRGPQVQPAPQGIRERQVRLGQQDLRVLPEQTGTMERLDQPVLPVLPEQQAAQVLPAARDPQARKALLGALHSNTISPHLLLLLTPAQVISD